MSCVPASATLVSLLATAMPDASCLPLLQNIANLVTSELAIRAAFSSEMRKHGLTALQAGCIAAYTCDARPFGLSREQSPFFMCERGRMCCAGL